MWSHIPKKTFLQTEMLSFDTYNTLASFNKGYITIHEMLVKLGIVSGEYTTVAMKRLNRAKVIIAKHAHSLKQKLQGQKKY